MTCYIVTDIKGNITKYKDPGSNTDSYSILYYKKKQALEVTRDKRRIKKVTVK